MNVASGGKFSSDRTIRQYASEIWHITPSSRNPRLIHPASPILRLAGFGVTGSMTFPLEGRQLQ